MANSRPWPFEDDDRPSGSVRPLSQSELQGILAHLTSDPDELLASTDAEQPVVAVRVPASVGQSGGSAQVTWRRARAAEWAAWTRTLPWRVAATLGIGISGGVLGRLVVPRFGLVVGALAAMAAGWGLRFRPSPEARAWRRGSGVPLECWSPWSARGGRSCTTWPSPAAGQPRPRGDRPRWGVRRRFQAVSRAPPGRPDGAAVAWPLPARPHPAGRVVRG
jgi:hypothetical protein